MRRILLPLFLLLFVQPAYGSKVHLLKISGIVNPVMAEFISREIGVATREGADALVIELDTPGGLDLAMRDIVKAVMASSVPVVVYVAPSGARAASAGVFITLSAHVAAMAPGTNIGAAHPVALGRGQGMDKTMEEKVVNDAVAYIRGIASKRGRNADWAEKAVRESVSITAEEALKLGVIDLIAKDLEGLLKAIDGRKVDTVLGEKVLDVKDAEVITREMGWRLKILDTISNPNVAYILMMIGLAGLYFELSNPGAILPGVIGVISLILAFYAFQTLPVNYAGVLLVLLAVILFIMELYITSYGLLTLGGIVSLALGSLMLFESPFPYLRVSLSVLLPTLISISLFFIVAIWLAVKARLSKPITGMEGLIGEEGMAETDLTPEGKVFVHGELWDAMGEESIRKGERVKVKGIKGLRIIVEKERR